MKIYITHSTSFDYLNELYNPIINSEICDEHEIILPHKNNSSNSKITIKETDLIIAECSYPSTGSGIELGWADEFGIPIIILSKKGSNISQSLKIVSSIFIEYENFKDMIKKIEEEIKVYQRRS